MECDKCAIIKRVAIPTRDLRILGPVFSHSSNILAREKAMVVNLEFIRATVTAEEVLILDLLRQEVLPFVDQLRQQTPLKRPFDIQGTVHTDSQENELHVSNGGQWVPLPEAAEGLQCELPFEFQVLETALERDAYPVLDELARNVSTKNLEHVRSLKSNLTPLLACVQKARDETEHLLDDNEDMADLYLTRKWVQNQQAEALLGTATSNSIISFAPHLRRLNSDHSASLATGSILYENDVEELEMLLEAYFTQLDGTRNKILSVREYIDDTEDYENIKLDQQRNELIQLQLTLTIASFAIAMDTLVASFFGMNIPCRLYEKNGVFDYFLGATGMASTGQSQSLKRRDAPVTREGDQLTLTPLGAGNEVGRSCVYMSYKGKTVLFDCGIHPAYSGMAALPYFDEIDPSTIDVLLITHFHLDHAASLPYFLEKTTFKGRVFMTHATKAIYKLLLTDYVKVSKVSVEDMLFDEQDINRSMDKIEVIDFHQTVEVNGIKFWCYTAGHVLGAAMFMVDIAGVRVLYTGDYSPHQPRHIREKRFTDVIHSTISQGGRVLIPAFALGRAQELLLILDEYWSNHPELHNIPIYYASPLAKKCMTVYQTYILSMNERIRNQFANSNPFKFKHISPLNSIEDFTDVGPSVVMASPSGLQSGLSRQLFDMWCSDKKNACVIPGYVVEGTLAKTIINEPKEVTLMNGLTAPLNMQVHYISFSAHADYAQTSTFLKELMPPNIILVHGEANEMGRLKQKLITEFADGNTKIITPKNCQSVEMYFNSEKMAKTIGKLAEKTPDVGETVSGILVKKGFTYQIMAPEDLHVFSQLSTANITQRITIPFSGAFGVIKHRLEQIYESVESGTDEESGVPTLQVHERVTVKLESDKHISLHWNADPISDMVSDSVVALVLNISREVPKVVVESEAVKSEEENGKKAEKVIYALLVSLFGDVKRGENGKLVITVDGNVAQLDRQSGDVESENEGLKERVRTVFRRIQGAVRPIPLSAS
ncbi:hypothetical protein GH714_019927 [Hevea brasiliensis]|uniref:Metallo-beta-lactamase domain-containing protein n=1 Tax=Hevea brasiliensis TaxID=3981 RepID=A0A6A6N370_HEVBR|nr:hypothetical protein GH714_019927 [Hevea brasiliensis]